MTFDPIDDQRRRDAEQRARDAEQRERDRAKRESDRERERADREREHEQRREERRARHEARHEFGFRHRGLDIKVDVDPDEIARSVSAAFVGMDSDDDTETHDQTVEKTFAVDGMPRVRVQNVSGEIAIGVGESGQVRVVAHKRVKGGSADRAKRLLENVEVRMEQEGNDVLLKPHLYEQDRGWADLFRGGRVAVDFEITVPREVRIEGQTVSGDFELAGTRGPLEVQSVSGDVRLDDAQGPLRLKTVSGDAVLSVFGGQLVANTVSGDLTFERVRLHGSDIVSVSGEIRIDGELDKAREHRLKTISGDIDLRLTGGSYDIRFSSMSGDLDSEMEGEISVTGRRDKHVMIGAAETKVTVKTMSGDLEIRASGGAAPDATETSKMAAQPGDDLERTEPMAPVPPVPPVPPMPPRSSVDVRDLLDRVAKGEIDVDAAAAALDARRDR